MKRNHLVCIMIFSILFLVLFSGCAMTRLNKDLRRLEDTYVPVSGRVIVEGDKSDDVLLILWPESTTAGDSGFYWLLGNDLQFSINVPPGKYYLLSFQDNDRNSYYSEDEPVGILKDPELIDTNQLETLTDRVITLGAYAEQILPEFVINRQKLREENDIFEWRESFVGPVVDLLDPAFGADAAFEGYWEPLTFLEEYGITLGLLESWDPDRIPILFVHGATGYPQEFTELIENLDMKKYQPLILSYPSGLRLDIVGSFVNQILIELSNRDNFKELVIVAHSMGGLLTRHVLSEYVRVEDFYDVPLYITISTPWNGHTSAGKGVQYSPVIVPSWYDMVPNNPLIKSMFEKGLPENTVHHLFFSFRNDGGGGENTDGSVSIASQLFMPAQKRASSITGIDAGHVGILSHESTLEAISDLLSEFAYE